jgi:hypothetical protein
MSGEVFKLHKETIPQKLEFVSAELMEVFLPAHFIERSNALVYPQGLPRRSL